jgi:beta-N-acetylhexosaminidase
MVHIHYSLSPDPQPARSTQTASCVKFGFPVYFWVNKILKNFNLLHSLQTMSLEEKIGQMLLVGFRGPVCLPDSPICKAIQKVPIGAVWLTEHQSSIAGMKGNIESFSQVQTLISDMQSAASIPLFVSIDAACIRILTLKNRIFYNQRG